MSGWKIVSGREIYGACQVKESKMNCSGGTLEAGFSMAYIKEAKIDLIKVMLVIQCPIQSGRRLCLSVDDYILIIRIPKYIESCAMS